MTRDEWRAALEGALWCTEHFDLDTDALWLVGPKPPRGLGARGKCDGYTDDGQVRTVFSRRAVVRMLDKLDNTGCVPKEGFRVD